MAERMGDTEQTSAGRMSGNPVFPGWYADPELHIFEGRYYIYPTYSAPFDEQTFFECWSSADLTDWVNHGRILDFKDVPWSTNRAAWAPSIAHKDGVYYYYFSAGDGAGIGVATATHPAGPFTDALSKPLVDTYPHGAQPIDAHCFIDDDGHPYLYFGGWRHAVVARLNPDMVSFATDFVEITPKNYVEGPFMLKRNGVYYFMWSEGGWGDSSYCVAHARADNPFGPFERVEDLVLCNNDQVARGAGHHSVIRVPGTDDWYICYHRRPLSETDANHRVTCIDRLYFTPEGAIAPVVLTNKGVPARPLPADAMESVVD